MATVDLLIRLAWALVCIYTRQRPSLRGGMALKVFNGKSIGEGKMPTR